MKVYLATTGEYSDYRVLGVFATEKLADAVGDVEELDLYDKMPPRRSWRMLYGNLYHLKDGSVVLDVDTDRTGASFPWDYDYEYGNPRPEAETRRMNRESLVANHPDAYDGYRVTVRGAPKSAKKAFDDRVAKVKAEWLELG